MKSAGKMLTQKMRKCLQDLTSAVHEYQTLQSGKRETKVRLKENIGEKKIRRRRRRRIRSRRRIR